MDDDIRKAAEFMLRMERKITREPRKTRAEIEAMFKKTSTRMDKLLDAMDEIRREEQTRCS